MVKYFNGYPIYLSDKLNKKYVAIVDGKKVYFGARGYDQYKDKIGYYSKYDHLDQQRRKRYYLRHPINYPKGSADWFSKKLLW